MDPNEVKDHLKSVVNSLIKDQPDEASKELHDVLAAKMRNRISGEPEVADEVETETPDAEVDAEVETDSE